MNTISLLRNAFLVLSLSAFLIPGAYAEPEGNDDAYDTGAKTCGKIS